MKLRAIWQRRGGHWAFYRADIQPAVYASDHIIEDCPQEVWDRFETAEKEYLAAANEIANLIPPAQRYAIIRMNRWTPSA
jgi:hypothetical protein